MSKNFPTGKQLEKQLEETAETDKRIAEVQDKQVLATKRIDAETERVLVKWHSRSEFVVWTRPIARPTEYFWGHYFQELTQATEYFKNN